jgi:hypothetical protein
MRTVKVKIAVAVDPQGRWYAHGSGGKDFQFPENHDELLETVDTDQCGPNEKLYWITAELIVPQIETVAGETTIQRS